MDRLELIESLPCGGPCGSGPVLTLSQVEILSDDAIVSWDRDVSPHIPELSDLGDYRIYGNTWWPWKPGGNGLSLNVIWNKNRRVADMYTLGTRHPDYDNSAIAEWNMSEPDCWKWRIARWVPEGTNLKA